MISVVSVPSSTTAGSLARRAPACAPTRRHHSQHRRHLIPRRTTRIAAGGEFTSDDGEKVKYEIALADVSRGKKIGSGSFGDVFEGRANGSPAVLKERKNTAAGSRFFRAEAEVNRRLKGCNSVASFLGVAGANAFLVWKDEGRLTLEDALGRSFASSMGCLSDEQAARKVAKGVLQCVKGLHGRGVIHRDVKPNNLLITKGGVLKLIDLGGAADLRTGTNFDEAETVFDPVYGPPERYITGKFGGLFGGLAWGKSKPDLFDAFSCGMVIMQVSCPSMRKKNGMAGVRRELKIWAYDLPMWRASLPDRRQGDFAILDANNEAGWKLVCGLCAQKDKRMSVSQALGSPFCR